MEHSDVTSRLHFQPLERTGYSEVLFEPCYSCYEVSQVLLPGHAFDLGVRREDARTLEMRPLGAVSLQVDSGFRGRSHTFYHEWLWAAGHCPASHWRSLKGRFIVLSRFSEADVTVLTGKSRSPALILGAASVVLRRVLT